MKLRWNWKRWPFAAFVLLFSGVNAFAHEKWYVDERQVPSGPSVFALVDPTFALALAALAVATYLFIVWLDRRYDGSSVSRWVDAKLAALPFNPRTVLGVTIGVSLMGAGLQHTLFSPSLALPNTVWGSLLAMCEIALGTLFVFLEPFFAELGVLLALLFVSGAAVLPFWDLMEELLLLGMAVFVITSETTRRPWRAWSTPERKRMGYQIFRTLVGFNFLVLAFVKWLRPELGLAVVARYHLNFLGGLGASDAQFIYLAAIVETLIALCILLRVAFRPALVVAFVFFLVSIFSLGFIELLGHLPIQAALFLFFVYGHWHKGEQKP